MKSVGYGVYFVHLIPEEMNGEIDSVSLSERMEEMAQNGSLGQEFKFFSNPKNNWSGVVMTCRGQTPCKFELEFYDDLKFDLKIISESEPELQQRLDLIENETFELR